MAICAGSVSFAANKRLEELKRESVMKLKSLGLGMRFIQNVLNQGGKGESEIDLEELLRLIDVAVTRTRDVHMSTLLCDRSVGMDPVVINQFKSRRGGRCFVNATFGCDATQKYVFVKAVFGESALHEVAALLRVLVLPDYASRLTVPTSIVLHADHVLVVGDVGLPVGGARVAKPEMLHALASVAYWSMDTLDVLWSNGIAHQDIKPDNMLVFNTLRPRSTRVAGGVEAEPINPGSETPIVRRIVFVDFFASVGFKGGVSVEVGALSTQTTAEFACPFIVHRNVRVDLRDLWSFCRSLLWFVDPTSMVTGGHEQKSARLTPVLQRDFTRFVAAFDGSIDSLIDLLCPRLGPWVAKVFGSAEPSAVHRDCRDPSTPAFKLAAFLHFVSRGLNPNLYNGSMSDARIDAYIEELKAHPFLVIGATSVDPTEFAWA